MSNIELHWAVIKKINKLLNDTECNFQMTLKAMTFALFVHVVCAMYMVMFKNSLFLHIFAWEKSLILSSYLIYFESTRKKARRNPVRPDFEQLFMKPQWPNEASQHRWRIQGKSLVDVVLGNSFPFSEKNPGSATEE